MEVFYIGKGKNTRYKTLKDRNIHFINTVKKYNCKPIIVHDNLSEDEAFDKELEYISWFKNINQASCNYHEGGRGGDVFKYAPPEKKQQMIERNRLSNTGVKNGMYGKKMRDIMGNKRFEELVLANKKGQLKSYQDKPERREHLSEIMVKRFENPENRLALKIKNSKRVYMFSEDGLFLRKFDNIDDVLDFLKIKNHMTIKKNIKLHKKYKGYYWLREEVEGVETIETSLNYFKLTE